MLVINPARVRFDGDEWANVSAVSVDRQATKLIEDFSDEGPFCAFVDAPEQRVTVSVRQALLAGDLPDAPKPGDSGELLWWTAAAGGVGRSARVSVSAVVVAVAHAVSSKDGAVRTVTFRGVSATGAEDPVTVDRTPPA